MFALLILSIALVSGAASAVETNQRNSLAIERFPTIVQIEFHTPQGSLDWSQGCAASVLNELFVLTAASCFSGRPHVGPQNSRVRAGANWRSMGGQIVFIERTISHDNRNSSAGVFHDIAVVKLTSLLFYNELVRQTRLLRQGAVVPDFINVFQVGWGWGGHSIPLRDGVITTLSINNAPGNVITGIIQDPHSPAVMNADVGSPWIWGGVTVGVKPAFDQVSNATSGFVHSSIEVSKYTNWIMSVAR